MSARDERGPARGFTLIEVVLALGLVSIVFLALVRLLDTSLTILRRSDTARETSALGDGVLDLLDHDLESLEGGPRGDLLAEWTAQDADGDGIATEPFLRLRFVRQASAADLLRLDPKAAVDPRAIQLQEVCWAVLPAVGDDPDLRGSGVVLRGVRSVGDEDSLSFFDADAFDARGRPLPGSLDVVSGGVLWLEALFASQTSVVRDGWKVGTELADVGASWDARGLGRPDEAVHEWNRKAPGMVALADRPVLPRRIRLAIEVERPADLSRRPRLEDFLEKDAVLVSLDDDRTLPRAGGFVLVGEEWMEVRSVQGARLTVRRGMRGTRPAPHERGALVHFGARQVRDVPVALYREDWDL